MMNLHDTLIIYGILGIVLLICIIAQSQSRRKPFPRDSETLRWGVKVNDPDSAIGAGWYVEVDGRRVAELTEPRCSVETPFWLSYVIVPLTDDSAERKQLFTLDFWHSGRVQYRSRKYDMISTGVLVSGIPPCPETNRIIARGFNIQIDPGPSLVERFVSRFKKRENDA